MEAHAAIPRAAPLPSQPQGLCLFTQLQTLIIRIQQESAEATRHVVVAQKLQIVLAEFKLHWELQVDLWEGSRGQNMEDPRLLHLPSPKESSDQFFLLCRKQPFLCQALGSPDPLCLH